MGIVTVVIGLTVRASNVPDLPADYLNLKPCEFASEDIDPGMSGFDQVRRASGFDGLNLLKSPAGSTGRSRFAADTEAQEFPLTRVQLFRAASPPAP
jgi:hypothetical protein